MCVCTVRLSVSPTCQSGRLHVWITVIMTIITFNRAWYFKYPTLKASVLSERLDVYMYSMFLDLRIYEEQLTTVGYTCLTKWNYM